LDLAPQLESWNAAGDPEQLRLQPFLDHAESLITACRPSGPWAFRLDVGRSVTRNLLDGADVDNFVFPIVKRLNDSSLVSVWCTKQIGQHSYVRAAPAHELRQSTAEVFIATPTASYDRSDGEYKSQVQRALAGVSQLPDGPVRLELSFRVGAGRKWWYLWKPTIDSLEPLLGRDPRETRAWHPRDGRITELGMHLTVDPAFRHDVMIGLVAVSLRD
jgi:hypothetical protein